MGIHDYMAVGRKLSIEDDRSNLITGLIVMTVVFGGYYCYSYRLAKERNRQIAWLHQHLEKLKDQNRRQGEAYSQLVEANTTQQQRINYLERENQVLAGRLGDNVTQEADS